MKLIIRTAFTRLRFGTNDRIKWNGSFVLRFARITLFVVVFVSGMLMSAGLAFGQEKTSASVSNMRNSNVPVVVEIVSEYVVDGVPTHNNSTETASASAEEGKPADAEEEELADEEKPTEETADGENPAEYVAQAEVQTGNIFVDIADGNVPLGGFRTSGVWSLFSLILSLIAVGSSIAFVSLSSRRQKVRKEDTPKMDKYEKKRNEIIRWASFAFGALTLLLWLLLDDFTTPMTWVNQWTLYIGFCFLIHLVLLLTFAIRLKTEELYV